MPKINKHHHGNLKSALVAAGIEILEEAGPQGLTLRKCAARAGVSHAAPAHHFDGLSGLLSAIATQGFEDFSRAMNAARAQAAPEPLARLMAICEGYLAYARENEALFSLMFSSSKLRFDDAALSQASDRAYRILAECCAPFKGPEHEDEASLETAIWALVHGVAMLSSTMKARENALQSSFTVEFQSLVRQLVSQLELPAKYFSSQ